MRAVGVADLQAIGMLDDRRRLTAKVDRQSLVRHLLGDALADFAVEAAQQPLAAIGKRALHAEAVEDGGEFERDVAAAHDQRALRQALEVERVVGGDRMPAPGDRRHHRRRAGGDQNVFRRVALAVQLHRVRIYYGGAPAQDLDPCHREHALVHAVEPRDLLVLVPQQGRPVKARRAGRPAVGLRDLELFAPVRRVREKLLRYAADVDAGAAEEMRFGDGDFDALGGRDAAGAHAAGTAAYGEKVVIEAYFRFFRFSSTSSSSVVMRLCCGLSASHLMAFLTRCSICAFGMPSTPWNMEASSFSLADCAALRTSASLPSIAPRSRLVTMRTVLSSAIASSPSRLRSYPAVRDFTSA